MQYSIKLEALTPIWTGDFERSSKRIKETGIIGSLRWWYEALVRAYNGRACNITSDASDDKKCNYEKSKKICNVCQMFGCTGWSRKFRVEISDMNYLHLPKLSIGTREKHETRKGWKYLTRNVEGIISKELVVLSKELKPLTKEERFLLSKTFEIIEGYSAIGARTSQGCGVVKLVESKVPEENIGNIFEERKEHLKKYWGEGSKGIPGVSICDFRFSEYTINFADNIGNLIEKKAFWIKPKEYTSINVDEQVGYWQEYWKDGILPIAFQLRDYLRKAVDDRQKRHQTFGFVERRDAQGSKVFVSHAYGSPEKNTKTARFRIWGYDIKGEVFKTIREQMKKQDKFIKYLFDEDAKEIPKIEISMVYEKMGSDLL